MFGFSFVQLKRTIFRYQQSDFKLKNTRWYLSSPLTAQQFNGHDYCILFATRKDVALKKTCTQFLAYMVHKGWRASTPPAGSCCLYFLKHPEINSMTKCPWHNKVESERPGIGVSGSGTWERLWTFGSLISHHWAVWSFQKVEYLVFRMGHWQLTSCLSEIKMIPRRWRSKAVVNSNTHQQSFIKNWADSNLVPAPPPRL